jgi:hypothetical protein
MADAMTPWESEDIAWLDGERERVAARAAEVARCRDQADGHRCHYCNRPTADPVWSHGEPFCEACWDESSCPLDCDGCNCAAIRMPPCGHCEGHLVEDDDD